MNSFRSWYSFTVLACGDLVTPATAARLLEISTQHLNRIIQLGRIKKHYYNKIPYIGMNDIEKEIEHRRQNVDISEAELENILKLLEDSKASKVDILKEMIQLIIKHAGAPGIRLQKAILKVVHQKVRECL